MKELPTTEAKLPNEATEMLRVVYDPEKKGFVVLCRFGVMNDTVADELPPPESDDERNYREVVGWSMMITDLIGHVANYMQSQGVGVDKVVPTMLNTILNDFKNGQNITGTAYGHPTN